MNMRKKMLGLVGALALTMSMAGGIVSAQEIGITTTSGSAPITFVVACGAGNSAGGTSTASIGASDGTTDAIAFDVYDPSDETQAGTVSTAENAFRVNVSLYCPSTVWSVTAKITDFVDEANPDLVIEGSHFQLVSTNQWTTDGTTPAVNVNEPASPVVFSGAAAPYTSPAIAQAAGATTDSSMYMDFTGQLVGLDGTVADGNYSAEITVTLNPGGTP
jgi:hypothetical protein